MSRSIVTGNPQSVPRATLSALGASEAPGASAQGSAGAAPTGEVLAASTTAPAPVLGINSPTQLALATIPGVVAHAYGAAAGGFGSQPEVLKIALVLAWLAINGAGFLVYRKRLASVGAGEVFPLTLGAVTYRSGAGTRA